MLGSYLLPKRRALFRGIASCVTSLALSRYAWFAQAVGVMTTAGALANATEAAPNVETTSSYQAPATCPSRDEFLSEVRARTSLEAQSVALSIAQRALVEISVEARVVRGKLTSAANSPREVVGSTCAEVVQALALVVALQAKHAVQSPSIQALSGSEVAAQPLKPNPVSTPTPVVAESNIPTPQTPPALPTTERSHAAPPLPRPQVGSSLRLDAGSVRLRASLPERTARWVLGGGAMSAFGTAPVSLYGASLFVEHQPISRLPFSIVLGTELTPRRTYKIQEESAAFQWLASRANACVGALTFADRSGLWLCGEVVGGLTIATGRASDRITQGRTVYEAWFSSGPAARLRFGLPTRLSLDLAAALDFPIIRHSTRFSNPDIPVHETGNLAGFLFLQVGYASGGSDPRSAAIAK